MKITKFICITLILLLTSCNNGQENSVISDNLSDTSYDDSSNTLSIVDSSDLAAPDFRDFFWGDTIEKVKDLQGQPFKETQANGGNTIISYPDVYINGVDTILYMCFNKDNMLYSAYYDISITSLRDFDTKDTQKRYASYYTVFQNLSDSLTEKYGDPIINDITFTQPRYKERPEYYGMYLSNGRMKINYEWETDTTLILLVFEKDSYGLFYFSKEYDKSEIPDIGV